MRSDPFVTVKRLITRDDVASANDITESKITGNELASLSCHSFFWEVSSQVWGCDGEVMGGVEGLEAEGFLYG